MNLKFLLQLLATLQFFTLSQSSHVQKARNYIRTEVRSAVGHRHRHSFYAQPPLRPPSHFKSKHSTQYIQRLHNHPSRWSGRWHSSDHNQRFTRWTPWTTCDHSCVKRRERFCKAKRKCGYTKHVEEQKCWHCHPQQTWHDEYSAVPKTSQLPQQNTHGPIIINAAAAASSGTQPTQSPQHVSTESVYVPTVQHVHHVQHVPVLPVEIIEHQPYQPIFNYPPITSAPIIRGIEHVSEDHNPFGVQDEAGVSDEDDFFIFNEHKRPHKFNKNRKPLPIDATNYEESLPEEYSDFEDEEDSMESSWDSAHLYGLQMGNKMKKSKNMKQHQRNGHKNRNRSHKKQRFGTVLSERSLAPGDDGIEGDVFQYEDFDFEQDAVASDHYNDSYDSDDNDYLDFRNASFYSKEKSTIDGLTPKHRRLYSKWSRWTKCSPKCTTRRYKKCRVREQCGREVLREIAYCYTEGSFCEQWLQAQVHKAPPYELRPMSASRRRDNIGGIQSNSIVSDYIMSGKGYRGPEYAPMKLKCGIPSIRSNKRSMYNMLKIIGGKAARKGEWPWQVAIFNRFREAFCGGTLIAPNWVLTAAHCVRKVLYVRIGEHNLDYADGTELQLRILKSFKHPNFDKKTVDSDVALLKLPKPVNATNWIGFSCLPTPYQPLPKNMECTVIGWGKRRSRDISGTSVLHQAEVPIISMDNCRSVYQDYTITKNMFCAGHKKGRIDTCAGDSGGPLLCRDTTKPNHPWTIFGITSFGDGCAKRNKFGIYAKVSNYVDWVWSVINCNGNCKLYQRS
ncbi:uncharacterized protein LOC119665663 [Teleopsis dalmanni]|uniref:uncharacterized protein LOC119665663 n=1 Tax=Teleopsis dalmanni TaxID=139649 RepID=UPI0018CD5639|nr:uncharacterized protein LOC119665663 [Teleopsis dalmanni]XP_037930825.1 uncharacterized protein LOC119665663 [Teleopsis dalmanni]